MNTNDQNELPDSRPRLVSKTPRGCAIPGRTKDSTFGGWGPRLLGVAVLLAAGASGTASFGATLGARTTCVAPSQTPNLARLQQPGWPDAFFEGLSAGRVGLEVDLDESANVRGVRIGRSSGDPDLDQAAKRLVQAARFVVPDGACLTTTSTYRFTVESVR